MGSIFSLFFYFIFHYSYSYLCIFFYFSPSKNLSTSSPTKLSLRSFKCTYRTFSPFLGRILPLFLNFYDAQGLIPQCPSGTYLNFHTSHMPPKEFYLLHPFPLRDFSPLFFSITFFHFQAPQGLLKLSLVFFPRFLIISPFFDLFLCCVPQDV